MDWKTLTYPLDEFRPWTAPDGQPLDILVYGEATIAFDGAGDWRVDGIEIESGKSRVALDDDHPLFDEIAGALEKREADGIIDRITQALIDDGHAPIDPHAEHRLTGRELGVVMLSARDGKVHAKVLQGDDLVWIDFGGHLSVFFPADDLPSVREIARIFNETQERQRRRTLELQAAE